MVKEGLTWLVCWRDEVQKMQVQEANVAIDYRNAARCKSYSDSRQCWRNTSVHGHVACLVGRARDPLDDVAPVQHVCMCVSCVYDFARFVYLLHCSELYSAALSLCMRFGAPRRLIRVKTAFGASALVIMPSMMRKFESFVVSPSSSRSCVCLATSP